MTYIDVFLDVFNLNAIIVCVHNEQLVSKALLHRKMQLN